MKENITSLFNKATNKSNSTSRGKIKSNNTSITSYIKTNYKKILLGVFFVALLIKPLEISTAIGNFLNNTVVNMIKVALNIKH